MLLGGPRRSVQASQGVGIPPRQDRSIQRIDQEGDYPPLVGCRVVDWCRSCVPGIVEYVEWFLHSIAEYTDPYIVTQLSYSMYFPKKQFIIDRKLSMFPTSHISVWSFIQWSSVPHPDYMIGWTSSTCTNSHHRCGRIVATITITAATTIPISVASQELMSLQTFCARCCQKPPTPAATRTRKRLMTISRNTSIAKQTTKPCPNRT